MPLSFMRFYPNTPGLKLNDNLEIDLLEVAIFSPESSAVTRPFPRIILLMLPLSSKFYTTLFVSFASLGSGLGKGCPVYWYLVWLWVD